MKKRFYARAKTSFALCTLLQSIRLLCVAGNTYQSIRLGSAGQDSHRTRTRFDTTPTPFELLHASENELRLRAPLKPIKIRQE